MKTKFEMSYSKIVFIFFAGIIAGGSIDNTLTNKMSILSGSLVVLSMILILVTIMIGSNKLEKNNN